MSPFSGHKVAGLNSSQADNPVVCSTVAHHTDALNRQEDNESLADFVIPTCIAKFFNEDRISFSQKIGVFAFNSAENTNAEAGTRERMTINHFGRQSQCDTEFTNFVFEESAKRFEKLQMKCIGQTADIMVGLNGLGFLGLGAVGFNG